MAKKDKAPAQPPPKKQEEVDCEEGLPMWMATFSDMVTLLLCFFVLLLSFANQDVTKFRTMMGSIKDAFGVQVKRRDAEFAAFSPSNVERKDVKLDQQDQAVLGMVMQLKALSDRDLDLKKSVKITTDDMGAIMRVPNALLFDPGSAKLKPTADKVLNDVIKILKTHNFDLVVRGNTDDEYQPNPNYPSNWELSASRAAASLRYIMEKGGIEASRLKAVGYADSMPLVPNNSPQNRALNRRMEFFFHRPEEKSW